MDDDFIFNQWPYTVWNVRQFFEVRQLKSPTFTVQNFNFHLILQQSCYKDASKDCFEIYLVDTNGYSKENNDIVVNTYIRNKSKKIRFTQTTWIERSESLTCHRIWSLKRKILLKECEDISSNEESLTFVCMFGPESVCEEEVNKNPEGYGIFEAFEDDVFLTILSDDFEKLLRTGDLSDVKFKCDEHEYRLHKAVLSARSKAFAEKFHRDPGDHLIEITDIDYSIFTPLLWFIYTGRLPEISENKVPYLYEASERYGIQTLQKRCAYFMTMNLTKDNALNRLVLADDHDDLDFKNNVISFLIKHIECLKDESWMLFCDERPDLAFEVYREYVENSTSKKSLNNLSDQL